MWRGKKATLSLSLASNSWILDAGNASLDEVPAPIGSMVLARKRDFGDHAQSKDAKDAGLCGPPSMNGGLIGGPPLPVLFP